jgi:hypothetical protein
VKKRDHLELFWVVSNVSVFVTAIMLYFVPERMNQEVIALGVMPIGIFILTTWIYNILKMIFKEELCVLPKR